MKEAPKAPRFLEPIYINEPMVLNCAAYLFQGIALEAEEFNSGSEKRGLFARAGIPFLSDVIGLSIGGAKESSYEARANRRFTVGGLHMNVLDQLYEKKMVTDISTISDQVLEHSRILDKYVHAHVILRATDYWSTLQALSMSGPLLAQVIQDYSEQISRKMEESSDIEGLASIDLGRYIDSLQSIVKQLLDDYLTSGQLEMIMWLDMQTPLGVIDLQIEEYDPRKLKAALVGGKYHVYGKITARARTDQKLSLLQRTSLFELQEMFARFLATVDAIENDAETQASKESARKARESVAMLGKYLHTLMRTEMKGPAIRMAGMSVCV